MDTNIQVFIVSGHINSNIILTVDDAKRENIYLDGARAYEIDSDFLKEYRQAKEAFELVQEKLNSLLI